MRRFANENNSIEWQKSHEVNILFTKRMLGTLHYFRNNSTNRPTLRHIINTETKKSFCGFDCYMAEVFIVDESDYLTPSCVCKKCLKSFNLLTQPSNQ